MFTRIAPALIAGVTLTACSTIGSLPSSPPPKAATPRSIEMPTTPIDFGDYAKADANTVMQRFSSQVRARYPQGAGLTAVAGDLKKNGFACSTSTATRGDPPDQVCKRTVRVQRCTSTWQVHLFDDKGAKSLSRVRALYDRQCAGDGLLGGPG